MLIASQTAISQSAPLASVAILTAAPCAKVPSNTAKKSYGPLKPVYETNLAPTASAAVRAACALSDFGSFQKPWYPWAVYFPNA